MLEVFERRLGLSNIFLDLQFPCVAKIAPTNSAFETSDLRRGSIGVEVLREKVRGSSERIEREPATDDNR